MPSKDGKPGLEGLLVAGANILDTFWTVGVSVRATNALKDIYNLWYTRSMKKLLHCTIESACQGRSRCMAARRVAAPRPGRVGSARRRDRGAAKAAARKT